MYFNKPESPKSRSNIGRSKGNSVKKGCFFNHVEQLDIYMETKNFSSYVYHKQILIPSEPQT